MKVRVDDLPPEGRTFQVEVGVPELQEALSRDRDAVLRWTEPARATVELHKAGRSLRVEGEASYRFSEPCARCLADVDRSQVARFDITKLLGPEPDHPRTRALRDDDADEDYLHAPEIDLDDVVLEQLALEIPQRVLCSEECRGLCPTCGANLNTETCRCAPAFVDPRFAVLAKLRGGDPPAES
jgi:uncharacterized protein